jgi:hypothetical protein
LTKNQFDSANFFVSMGIDALPNDTDLARPDKPGRPTTFSSQSTSALHLYIRGSRRKRGWRGIFDGISYSLSLGSFVSKQAEARTARVLQTKTFDESVIGQKCLSMKDLSANPKIILPTAA